MSGITKSAENPCRFRRRSFPFDSARSALENYMQFVGMSQDDEVLLPAYIGWSSREGSGVFDPITQLGVRYSFYRISSQLQIDIEDAKVKLQARRPKLLLVIHYFGFPDPGVQELCDFAHANGSLVLEDEAHAMLSDRVGGICGRAGDASIYSLHKLLPFTYGGRLVLNTCALRGNRETLQEIDRALSYDDYDLFSIAQRRRDNAAHLLTLLESANLPVQPLYADLPTGVVPQSLPILIKAGSRDELYCRMNSAGYGVVSLYHTLVNQIRPDEFPESHHLARHIMNLPVHQDIDPGELPRLVECMEKFLTS